MGWTVEKEMAAHSIILAWRIPGTEEPGGLPSMGSERVGHNWNDLAAAAARNRERGQAEWCGTWKCTQAHVFIHPVRLCLLVGAFNPFPFKVMIDICDPITVLLIVWGLFSVGLFLLLHFLPREVPLAFVVKLVWWCWILLFFAYLESFLFLHQVWRRVLLGRVVLIVGSSLSSL